MGRLPWLTSPRLRVVIGVHSGLHQFARICARRIRNCNGHVRLTAVGESDGKDAGEEGADRSPARTARSIQVRIPDDEIPPWNARKQAKNPARSRQPTEPRCSGPGGASGEPVRRIGLLDSGPTSKKFANKEISRAIEIRGDQTLEQLHHAIFKAYDRWDEHPYEFQFGKRPFDPDGPNYGVPGPQRRKKGDGDARTTKLDDLDLNPGRAFGYWFDFGDNWYHQVQVDRIDQAIPTVTYPRVIRRIGKSPPQYREE